MKDAAPRIFRSLEKPVGRDEFDTIVAAAAAAYGSLRSPSEKQAQNLGRLVAPVWDKVSAETRRNLAAALSHAPRMPRVLIDLLIASPVEISAPFLISSPALSALDLLAISRKEDPRIRRLAAGRAARDESRTGAAQALAPPAASPEPPRAASDPAPIAAAPAPKTDAAEPASPLVQPSPSLSPDFLSVTPFLDPAPAGPAAGVRQVLRTLVRSGRRTGGSAGAMPTLAGLIACAMERDEGSFYAALAQLLELAPERLQPIAADASGERLAVALKAMKAGPADALSVLMMLKPGIGLDVAAFERMTRYYRALRTEDCRSLLSPARRGTPAGPAHRPVEMEGKAHRPSAEGQRPDFGRRKVRPVDRRHQSGS